MDDNRLATLSTMFSKKLSILMQRNDYTQTSIATALDVSVPTVHGWLAAKKLPSAANLIELSSVLGVSIDSLLSMDEEIVFKNKTMAVEDAIVDRLNEHLHGNDSEDTIFTDVVDYPRFGPQLRHALMGKNWTTEQFAGMIKESVETVEAWISETTVPNLTQLISVCDTLGVSMDRIAYSRSPVICIQYRGMTLKDGDMLRKVADALRIAHKKGDVRK